MKGDLSDRTIEICRRLAWALHLHLRTLNGEWMRASMAREMWPDGFVSEGQPVVWLSVIFPVFLEWYLYDVRNDNDGVAMTLSCVCHFMSENLFGGQDENDEKSYMDLVVGFREYFGKKHRTGERLLHIIPLDDFLNKRMDEGPERRFARAMLYTFTLGSFWLQRRLGCGIEEAAEHSRYIPQMIKCEALTKQHKGLFDDLAHGIKFNDVGSCSETKCNEVHANGKLSCERIGNHLVSFCGVKFGCDYHQYAAEGDTPDKFGDSGMMGVVGNLPTYSLILINPRTQNVCGIILMLADSIESLQTTLSEELDVRFSAEGDGYRCVLTENGSLDSFIDIREDTGPDGEDCRRVFVLSDNYAK